ncbi:MAG TPA: hypothetical protein VNJ01_18105 [Bacteriovoracaceae bacterium]|nr:hypothetical protein [Bacteriovoracaceae bacterium]
MNFILLLLFCVPAAFAQGSDSLRMIQAELIKHKLYLEEEFATSVELQFQKTGTCLAEAGGHQIVFCDYFIKRLINTYGVERATAVATFTLFHEVGHIVFDPNLDGIPHREISALTSLDEVWLREFEYHIQHENLDGLAAKLFRQRQVPHPEAVYDFLKNMVSFASEANPLSEQERRVFQKVQQSRALKFRQSFEEGWAGWKGYNKLWGLCGESGKENLLSKYVMKKAESAFLMKASVGSQVCKPFGIQDLLLTFKDYSLRIR